MIFHGFLESLNILKVGLFSIFIWRYAIKSVTYFFFKNYLYNMHIVFHGVTNMPYYERVILNFLSRNQVSKWSVRTKSQTEGNVSLRSLPATVTAAGGKGAPPTVPKEKLGVRVTRVQPRWEESSLCKEPR